MTTPRPLLFSADADLVDDVGRLAAASGVDLQVVASVDALHGAWLTAPIVLVGADATAVAVSAALPRRRSLLVVARGVDDETLGHAAQLGAEHVVELPLAERWLVDRFGDGRDGPSRDGRVLCVVGSSGGQGASTFAATLALAAARSLRVLLVDADPVGGGLDVVLGLENEPGARWPDLAETRGRVAVDSLGRALPSVQGVDVLACARTAISAPHPQAMSAIRDAGSRGYDLVVVDVPRHLDPLGRVALSGADHLLLVVGSGVASIASGFAVRRTLGSLANSVAVVLRTHPRVFVDDGVLGALDAPVIGRLPTSRRVAARAEDGAVPSLRDAYGRACAGVLRALLADASRTRARLA